MEQNRPGTSSLPGTPGEPPSPEAPGPGSVARETGLADISPTTYWRRRALVLALGIALVAILVWAINGTLGSGRASGVTRPVGGAAKARNSGAAHLRGHVKTNGQLPPRRTSPGTGQRAGPHTGTTTPGTRAAIRLTKAAPPAILWIRWDRRTSAPGCGTTHRLAGAGTYTATAVSGGFRGKGMVFVLSGPKLAVP